MTPPMSMPIRVGLGCGTYLGPVGLVDVELRITFA
jgi:hypothetical protein